MHLTVDHALGTLGILGGAVLLLGFPPTALPWTPDTFNARLVLYGLGAMAVIVAVHGRQRAAGPRLAWSAAVPAFAAHALYTVLIALAVSRPGEIGAGDYGPLVFAAGLVMWLADAWFGMAIVRLGVVTRWGGLALAVGGPLALLGIDRLGLVDGPLAGLIVPLALVGVALDGLAWVLLGLDLVRQPNANRSSSLAHGLPRP